MQTRAPRVVVVVAPYLIGSWLIGAATAALVGSWRPTGDVAAIAVRSSDTFSRHIPLVGMPSTAGEGLHHPGPLQLWVNGLFDAVAGGRVSVLAATAAVNIAAVVVIVSVGRRLGGDLGALVAGIASFLLAWSLHGPLLVSPLNPHAALFPLAAALLAGVATAVRPTSWTVVAAVASGSYAAQAHLVFAVLVLAAAVPLALLAWRNSARDRRQHLAVLTGVVVCSAWVGPILDVVLHRGGNLRVLASVVRSEDAEATLGMGRALSVLAGAVAPSPVFLERGLSGAEVYVGASDAVTVAVVVAVALVVVEGVRRRRSRPSLAAAAVTTGVLVVASVLAIGRFPSFALNAFALHNYLPLWIVSIAVWGLTAGLVADTVSQRRRAPRISAAVAAAAVLAALAGVAASTVVLPRPTASAEMAYVGSLAAQLDAQLGDGAHLWAVHDDLELFGVDAGLVRALRDAGHAIVVPERVGQSFGHHRVADDPATTLTLGFDAPPDGDGEVVAEHRPDPAVVRRREAAIAALTETVLADPALLEDFAGSVSDRRSVERFVREDLAGFVSTGLLDGPLVDEEATRTLVRASEQPWRSVFVTQVVGASSGT